MERWCSVIGALWIAPMLIGGCASGTTLPQVDGGQPAPQHAAKVHFVELAGGSYVTVTGPGQSRPHARLALEGECCDYMEVFDFLNAELQALARRSTGGEELPVVILSDAAAPASRGLDWLSDPTRALHWAKPRIRAYIGLGDLRSLRMVEAPRRVRERSDGPLFTLAVDAPGSGEFPRVCVPWTKGNGDLMGRCAFLLDGVPSPAEPQASTTTARVAQQLCDALDQPFDLAWNGDSLQDLAELLVDDPRPARCHGETWLGWPNALIVDGLRPRQVPGWDRALAHQAQASGRSG